MYFFLYTSTMVSFHMGISLGSDHHSRSESLVKQAFEHCSLLAKHAYLVGALEHDFYDFPYIGNVIIPTDFHIFRRGETTNQLFSELGTSYIHASWFFFCSTWAWTFKEQAQDPVDHRSSVPLHFRIKKNKDCWPHISLIESPIFSGSISFSHIFPWVRWWHCQLPSGKLSHNYGKSPCSMGKLTINGHFQ